MASGSGRRAHRVVVRADDLAVIAAVDPVAQSDPVFRWECTGSLDQPCQAPVGIEHPRFIQGAGRACGLATAAGAAAVELDFGGDGQCRCRDHRAEHSPRAKLTRQQHRVAAQPAKPRARRCRPINEAVVVIDDTRFEPTAAQDLADRLEPLA